MSTITFDSGAVRNSDVAGDTDPLRPARYDLLDPAALRRWAMTCGEGALKYGDHNWEKGIPLSVLLNHLLAHLVSYMQGDRSEDHLGHALWNLAALIHFDSRGVSL